MFLSNSHSIQNFNINFIIININDVHFFSNTLESGFGAKLSDISTNETMRVSRNVFKINIFI